MGFPLLLLANMPILKMGNCLQVAMLRSKEKIRNDCRYDSCCEFLFLMEKVSYLLERWQTRHCGLFCKSRFRRFHHPFRIPCTGNNHTSDRVQGID